MTSRELYQAGRLEEAVQALGVELRDNPADSRRRTFLFELLCFSGNYDRAEKQLNILSQENKDAQMGALLYQAALHAERSRHDLFQKKDYPRSSESGAAVRGSCNGAPFEAIQDADPRLGARLEVYAAGQYLWIPFEHIASIEMQAPQRLRDLLWAPALVRTGPAFRGREMGEVLLPVLSPFSWQDPDEAVKLGRSTVWRQTADGETLPFGQKTYLIDDHEVSILELRHLNIQQADSQDHASA